MKALQLQRSMRRFVAARVLSSASLRRAVEFGPLSLVDIEPPALPASGWSEYETMLCGICGSDISTLSLRASPYYEKLTSFPFTPGHEIVAWDPRTSSRVLIEPALTCVVRGLPLCDACASGETQRCASVTIGNIDEGIQLGYCASTGGGWGERFVAHDSQRWEVPSSLSDEDAVMVEPLACAIHGALRGEPTSSSRIAIVGAGTVGLATLAALRALVPDAEIAIGAKYPIQREAARRLGADSVIAPGELARLGRRTSRSMRAGGWSSGGFDLVYDCAGTSDSLGESIGLVRPGGRVVLVGMPAKISIDMTPLFHREVEIRGTYAYGTERITTALATSLGIASSDDASEEVEVRTFALAIALMERLHLGWMVTHHVALDDYESAIERASDGGRIDALKVVFDLRSPRQSYEERTS